MILRVIYVATGPGICVVFRNPDGEVTKSSVKKCISTVYSISFKLSNVGDFFSGLEFLRTIRKFRKIKRTSPS